MTAPNPSASFSPVLFNAIPKTLPWEAPVSRFWAELEKDRSAEGEKLRVVVREVVEGAAALSGQVVRDMPFYTDHGERHLRNVLHIMETLVTEEGIAELQPIGCALCVVAAYIHDLGMVLSAEERAELERLRGGQEPSTEFGRKYRSHADAHPELVRERNRLLKAGDAIDAKCIEDHLLAEFLRRRHAEDNPETGAIARELKNLLGHPELIHADLDWFPSAVAIAASHGKAPGWLREKHCEGNAERIRVHLDGARTTNLVLPGLLLRLADIIDFDRSRTPEILFYHLGLGELGDDGAGAKDGRATSRDEWRKHLAVTGYAIDRSGADLVLRYVCNACPHPAVEHSIRAFSEWIDQECAAVAEELRRIHAVGAVLPVSHAELKIKAKTVKGRALYLYDPEFRFRLDQDQVMRLLMGANLYGDPAICIRELLQNSLDALELRQARLKRQDDHGKVGEPVDSLAKGESLRVDLSWGEEHGRRFIRVRDWGTGMTRDQIRRFFATVGRSYYQSPDFHAEQAALKRDGAGRVSPISQFGIGILSCFMVAERMTVRTHPGGAGKGREPSLFEVTGPGKLFVLREEGLKTQGTEITLWLKEHIQFEPWTAEQTLMQVKRALDYRLTTVETRMAMSDPLPSKRRSTMADLEGRVERRLHPGFEAMRHILWPLFPVGLRGPGVGETWEIDLDIGLHFTQLCPIDPERVAAEATKWLYRGVVPARVDWAHWDWTDPESGSRVRLVFPTVATHTRRDEAGLRENSACFCNPALFAAWCDEQLPVSGERARYLSRGVMVADVSSLVDDFVLGAGIGAWVWVDLRGELAPGITTARDRALPPAELAAWSRSMSELGNRFMAGLASVLPLDHIAAHLALAWNRKRVEMVPLLAAPSSACSMLRFGGIFMESSRSWCALSGARWLSVEITCQAAVARDGALARILALDRRWAIDRSFGLTFNQRSLDIARARELCCALKLAIDRAQHLQLDVDLDRYVDVGRDLDVDLPRDRALADIRARVRHSSRKLGGAWRLRGEVNFLNEAFFPTLHEAFPPLALWEERGQVCERWPAGPVLLPRGGHGNAPRNPLLLGIDFVFPLSVTPSGALREKVEAASSMLVARWREWHSVLTLPFLLPDAQLVEGWSEMMWGVEELDGLEKVSAFLPRLGLWETPYSEWKADDYPNAGYTAVWDLAAGTVKWHLGLVSATEVIDHGLEFGAFVKAPEVNAYHEWLRTLPEEQEAERDLAEWKKLNGESDDFL